MQSKRLPPTRLRIIWPALSHELDRGGKEAFPLPATNCRLSAGVNLVKSYAALGKTSSPAGIADGGSLGCCFARIRIHRNANAQNSKAAIASGSGVRAALNEARTARAVACGPYCSNVRLKFGTLSCAVSQPTRAGTNVAGGRCNSWINCLAVGSIGVAPSQGAMATAVTKTARASNFLGGFTPTLDARLWSRLDEADLGVQPDHRRTKSLSTLKGPTSAICGNQKVIGYFPVITKSRSALGLMMIVISFSHLRSPVRQGFLA